MEFKRLPLADMRRGQTAQSHGFKEHREATVPVLLCVRMWKSSKSKLPWLRQLPAETCHYYYTVPVYRSSVQWAWGTKAILSTHFFEIALKKKEKKRNTDDLDPHIKFSYFHYTNGTVKWESKKKWSWKRKSSGLGMEYWTCWFFLRGAQLDCLRKENY